MDPPQIKHALKLDGRERRRRGEGSCAFPEILPLVVTPGGGGTFGGGGIVLQQLIGATTGFAAEPSEDINTPDPRNVLCQLLTKVRT